MKFQRWFVAVLAALLLAGCGLPSNLPLIGGGSSAVARFGDATLSREELDARISRIQTGIQAQLAEAPQGSGQQVPSNQEVEEQLVKLFIQQNVLLKIANDRKVVPTDAEIDKQISDISTNLSKQNQTLDSVVQSNLGLADSKDPNFRSFISSLIAQDKIGATLVTTDTVEPQIAEQVNTEAKQEVEKAKVAHILVATEDEANKVIERLNNGEDFAALAKELSTDPGSKDNGGVYDGVEPGQMVAPFDQAVFKDLQPGETTKQPVKTDFGYHVIRLLERTKGPKYTEEQAKQLIDQQVAQALQSQRGTALKQLVDDETQKAKDAGTLVEPTYPTATPAAPQPTTELVPETTPQSDQPVPTVGSEAAPTTQP